MNIPKTNSALTPKSELPWSLKDAIIRLIFYYGLILVFLMTFQIGLSNLLSNSLDAQGIIIVEATIIGIVGLVMTFVFLSFDDKKMSSIGFTYHDKYRILGIIGIITTAIALTIAYAIEMSGGVVDSLDVLLKNRYFIENLSKPTELLNFSALAFITFFGIAVGEEIMFRGYIQNVLESQTSFLKATFVASILFGFVHSFLNLPGNIDVVQKMVAIGVSATIFGFVFSYAYKITGRNLFLPIIIHGTWDSIIYFFKTNYHYTTVFNVLTEIFSQIVAAIVLVGLLYVTKRFIDIKKS